MNEAQRKIEKMKRLLALIEQRIRQCRLTLKGKEPEHFHASSTKMFEPRDLQQLKKKEVRT